MHHPRGFSITTVENCGLQNSISRIMVMPMLLEFEKSADPQAAQILKAAAFGPMVFEVAVEVCSNPTCDCRHINLMLSSGTSDSPVRVECDLESRKISNTKELHTQGSQLAGAEIPEKDWEILKQAYCGKKQYYTECAVLEDLDASFPFEVSIGSMAGYYEILPYAKPVVFFHGKEEWLIDDQYCVKPKCDCADAAIHFIPKQPSDETIATRYNYASGTLKNVSEGLGVSAVAKELLASLKVAIPNLREILANRHATLRRIYQNSLQRRKTAPSFLVEKTPGRNDPCPCGSGKKYKKCCGA